MLQLQLHITAAPSTEVAFSCGAMDHVPIDPDENKTITAGKRMCWCSFDTGLKSVNFNTMATNTCECCDFDAELQHLPPARRVA
jgi:hypothetical protein